MRTIFILLLITILCSLTATGRADSNSDCLIYCSNEKRATDMYCPPAGGYSDEDHKQCMDKNTAAYNDCIKTCSPAPATPATPATSATPELPAQPADPGAADKQ